MTGPSFQLISINPHFGCATYSAYRLNFWEKNECMIQRIQIVAADSTHRGHPPPLPQSLSPGVQGDEWNDSSLQKNNNPADREGQQNRVIVTELKLEHCVYIFPLLLELWPTTARIVNKPAYILHDSTVCQVMSFPPFSYFSLFVCVCSPLFSFTPFHFLLYVFFPHQSCLSQPNYLSLLISPVFSLFLT